MNVPASVTRLSQAGGIGAEAAGQGGAQTRSSNAGRLIGRWVFRRGSSAGLLAEEFNKGSWST